MSQAESTQFETLQAEITHLKAELQLRDQLVDQLSQELFRLINNRSQVNSQPTTSDNHQWQLDSLKAQMANIEEQVSLDQRQIANRDAEIQELRTQVKTLTERNRSLEQMLQDLPQIYRQKFAQRIKPVKQKVEQLQQENQQLHSKVQTLTKRLAEENGTYQNNDIDQPSSESSVVSRQSPDDLPNNFQ